MQCRARPRPRHRTLVHGQFARLQRVLVLRRAPPQVEHADALGGRRLGHAQVQHQTRRELRELRVVGREPAGQDGCRAQSEVRGDGPLSGVQHGQRAAALRCPGPGKPSHEPGDPLPCEAVLAARPAVLRRLPLHEGAQRGRVAFVEHEPRLADLPAQLALLGQGGLQELRRLGAQHRLVRLVALLHVDDVGGVLLGRVPDEQPLLGLQVVEGEARHRAGLEEPARVQVQARPQDRPLRVRDAEPDRPALSQRAPFMGQEADRLQPLVHHRDPCLRPHQADGFGELRFHEWVARCLGGSAQCAPALLLTFAELPGPSHTNAPTAQPDPPIKSPLDTWKVPPETAPTVGSGPCCCQLVQRPSTGQSACAGA